MICSTPETASSAFDITWLSQAISVSSVAARTYTGPLAAPGTFRKVAA